MKKNTSAAGYSLMELIVSLFVLSLVLVGTLTLLDSSNRLAVNALNRSEMQQTLRVVQHDLGQKARMLGRGGLPSTQEAAAPVTAGKFLPQGLAVSLRDNVGAGELVVPGASDEVLERTDVLTVRGVFSTPVFLVNYSDETSYGYDPGTGQGFVVVRNITPLGGIPQDVTALVEIIGDPGQGLAPSGYPEGLLMVSPYDERIYAVVEIDAGNSTLVNSGSDITITLAFKTTGGVHSDAYNALSLDGAYPENNFTAVGTVAILEEYHYYIRDTSPDPMPSDPAYMPSYRLSRARVYPGTSVAYANDPDNLTIDIAENVLDLQVAIGIDADDDGKVVESVTGESDEWLFNAASGGSDGPGDAPLTTAILQSPAVNLRYLRISTLARSDQRAPNHISPLIDHIENRNYLTDPLNDLDPNAANYKGHRLYQREVLKTIVELRNM